MAENEIGRLHLKIGGIGQDIMIILGMEDIIKTIMDLERVKSQEMIIRKMDFYDMIGTQALRETIFRFQSTDKFMKHLLIIIHNYINLEAMNHVIHLQEILIIMMTLHIVIKIILSVST